VLCPEGCGSRNTACWEPGRRQRRPYESFFTVSLTTPDCTGRLASYFPTHRLTDSVYWHTHSLLRPSDHIQAAALAFASGSKMSLSPYGVERQVERMNWKRP
jgi:hypothetical protein